jgi:hypothetical protein
LPDCDRLLEGNAPPFSCAGPPKAATKVQGALAPSAVVLAMQRSGLLCSTSIILFSSSTISSGCRPQIISSAELPSTSPSKSRPDSRQLFQHSFIYTICNAHQSFLYNSTQCMVRILVNMPIEGRNTQGGALCWLVLLGFAPACHCRGLGTIHLGS